jgi:lipoprotein-anchoring transpeptidase ErfK/SrfK
MSHTTHDVPRPPDLHRGVSALGVALLTAAGVCLFGTPAPAAAGPRVPASQPLVVLLYGHIARSRPDVTARQIESVSAHRPLTRVRTVLPVLARATSRDGRSWVQVRLPGRPNSHDGWIPADETKRASTAWYIVLKLSSRRVTVYHDGRVQRRFLAVVGTPSTPTPIGRFFIEEGVELSGVDAGNPFALATSARSNVLQEFEGGPGQIALHGTKGLSGAPGTAASHGCIRLSTAAITWLAQRIGSGVPLTIVR